MINSTCIKDEWNLWGQGTNWYRLNAICKATAAFALFRTNEWMNQSINRSIRASVVYPNKFLPFFWCLLYCSHAIPIDPDICWLALLISYWRTILFSCSLSTQILQTNIPSVSIRVMPLCHSHRNSIIYTLPIITHITQLHNSNDSKERPVLLMSSKNILCDVDFSGSSSITKHQSICNKQEEPREPMSGRYNLIVSLTSLLKEVPLWENWHIEFVVSGVLGNILCWGIGTGRRYDEHNAI